MDWCPVHSNIREPDQLKRSHLCSSASFHSHEVLILGPAVRVPSSFVSICYVLWSKPYCLNVSAWHRVFRVAQQTSQHGRKSELWCFTGSKNHPSGKAVIKHWLSRTFVSHLFLFFYLEAESLCHSVHITSYIPCLIVILPHWFLGSEAVSLKKDPSIRFKLSLGAAISCGGSMLHKCFHFTLLWSITGCPWV